jgi:metallo-beta-lactamase class B
MQLLKYIAAAILLSPVLNLSTAAETRCLPPDAKAPKSWITPYPSHRIIGNLYAVGSEDLSVYLITTSEGHVLINTGLEDSTSYISKNIESLGFNIQDIKILLTMQAHFDHTAALAEIKQLTGA